MEVPILVTGTTGFLGSHFLLWLSQHRSSRVFALVRGTSEEHRRTRLTLSLQTAADGYRPQPDWKKIAADTQVVGGDIEEPLCGVGEADRRMLADTGIRELWHFAASLNFEESRRDLIRSQNIGGPRHAIALASALGAQRFIYVSTAYTAGAEDGTFAEVLHPRISRFSNVYEESKCEAEHLVTELCRQHALQLTILRPSIVIGCSHTYAPAGTSSGLYGFIREIHRLRRRLERTSEVVRIQADPHTPLNFIPVDAVMRDIMALIESDFASGPILHLSAMGGVSVGHLVASISRQLGIENLTVACSDPDSLSPLEQLLSRRITFYGSYLRSRKEFSRSLPARWEVRDEDFMRFVAEGVRMLAARRIPNAR